MKSRERLKKIIDTKYDTARCELMDIELGYRILIAPIINRSRQNSFIHLIHTLYLS